MNIICSHKILTWTSFSCVYSKHISSLLPAAFTLAWFGDYYLPILMQYYPCTYLCLYIQLHILVIEPWGSPLNLTPVIFCKLCVHAFYLFYLFIKLVLSEILWVFFSLSLNKCQSDGCATKTSCTMWSSISFGLLFSLFLSSHPTTAIERKDYISMRRFFIYLFFFPSLSFLLFLNTKYKQTTLTKSHTQPLAVQFWSPKKIVRAEPSLRKSC